MSIRMQFYLIEIFIITFVCAFGFGSLVISSPLSECLFFTFTLCILLMALLCAVARRGDKRFFWIGFAIAGCFYLYYVHLPDENGLVPSHDGPLITTQILREGFNLMHSGDYGTSFRSGNGFFSVPSDLFADDASKKDDANQPFENNLSIVLGGGQTIVGGGESIAFMRIGHSMWALLLGWIAGHFTLYVRRKVDYSMKDSLKNV
jgi:hypothetical protein